ncbi:hypothetical protein RHSIM_Rhsim07G0180300 [Rhododendron simsii]|uniref:Uncharacterized protein n=1 Tax=Rhododendron simsii TaxID=118357 RepID=A0A834LK39_RHOSS|nr:hypothetical protein RHSIM_Rhsim07G0180300 [Rhododendron simsii]
MGNWIEETFEVLWNWFTKTMVQSIASVDVLLAIFPLILFVASRILSAINSQYLKRLEEEEIKIIQKQIEEQDKQIQEIIVERVTLIQKNKELQRDIKARKEENARLKSKLQAHVLEKCAREISIRLGVGVD